MESNLIKPAREKFRTFNLSHIEFCEGNACAAGLIDVFDKFHTIKLEQRKHNKKYNDIAEQHGDGRTQNEGLLQPHTLDELNEYLLGMFSLNVIRTALKLLQDKGAISVHGNPNPRYKFDKRAHYLFHPDVYNGWLEQNSKLGASSRTCKSTDRSIRSEPSMPLNQNTDLSDLIDRSIRSDTPSIRSDRAIDNKDINIENNNLKPYLVSGFDKLNETENEKPVGKVEGCFFDFIKNKKQAMETLGNVGEELTEAQTEFLNAWFRHAKQSPSYRLSDPDSVFEEVKFQLLDKTQYQGCENSFYRKLSAIGATLRKGQWQTPYKLRENDKAPPHKKNNAPQSAEETRLKKEVMRLSNEIRQVLADVETNRALCEQLFEIQSSTSDGPQGRGHEDAILTVQEHNRHCLNVLKRLRQEREAAIQRLDELKRKGERHDGT